MADQKHHHQPRDIPTRTFIKFWLVMAGFLATVGFVYITLGALTLVGIAAFLAIALNPPVSAIASKLPGRSRIGATAIAYVIVVAILLGFVLTILPLIIEQMVRFLKTLPGIIEGLSSKSFWLTDIAARYGVESQYHSAIDNIQAQAANAAAGLGGSFITGIGSIVGILFAAVILLVLTFLMLIEGPTWMKRVWGLYHNQKRRQHHQDIVRKMYRVVTGFVNGQVVIAGISAVSSLVVVIILSAVFGMPANIAIPIAVIIFVTGLIPMFGATIGAIIAGLLLAINDFSAAVAFLVYFFIYQQVENNFISPTVQSRSVEISPLTVVVALTVGLSLFGIVGGLISIPIAGCIRVLVLDYLERHQISNLVKPTE